MPARRRIPDESIPKLQAVMANTGSKIEYQRALSVWLSAGAGLSDQQIATALGWTVRTVRAVRARFRPRGESSFRDRRLPLPEDDVARLPARMKQAQSVKEFRRLQCLWLGPALGLHSGQVGIAVGMSRGHVRNLLHVIDGRLTRVMVKRRWGRANPRRRRLRRN